MKSLERITFFLWLILESFCQLSRKISNVVSELASVCYVKPSERVPTLQLFFLFYLRAIWTPIGANPYMALLIYVDHWLTKGPVPSLFKGWFRKLMFAGEGLWHCGECILERATRQILRSQGMPFFSQFSWYVGSVMQCSELGSGTS